MVRITIGKIALYTLAGKSLTSAGEILSLCF